MTAIQTYFLGPTNFRGSRYKAVALGTGHTVTINADDRLDSHANHDRAVLALIRKMGWTAGPENKYGPWFQGDGGKQGFIYVMALDYARLEEPQPIVA